jgi:hypothetical protein
VHAKNSIEIRQSRRIPVVIEVGRASRKRAIFRIIVGGVIFLFILSRAADISECVSDTVSKRTRDGPPRQAYSNSLDEEYASRANDGTKNISIYRY